MLDSNLKRTPTSSDPKRLCHFLLDRSLNRGVKLHQPAKAISVSLDERGVLSGLRVAKESTGEVESGSIDVPDT